MDVEAQDEGIMVKILVGSEHAFCGIACDTQLHRSRKVPKVFLLVKLWQLLVKKAMRLKVPKWTSL